MPHRLDPLLSYLARPLTQFAVGRRERPKAAPLPSGLRIIAHRAGVGPAPENSLAAARHAASLGARDVEVDVRQTRDRRWVCLHDPDLNRVARVNRRVSELTLAELRRFRLSPGNEPIATLDEMLRGVPPGVRLHLDLKGALEPLDAAAANLLEVIDRCGAPRRVTVMSLDHALLARLRAFDGRLAIGYLTLWLRLDSALRRCLGRHRPSHDPRRAIDAAVALGALAIAPVALQPGLPAFAQAAHAAGLSVYVYTIDGAQAALRAAAAGADGIFTNRPERFLGLGGPAGIATASRQAA